MIIALSVVAYVAVAVVFFRWFLRFWYREFKEVTWFSVGWSVMASFCLPASVVLFLVFRSGEERPAPKFLERIAKDNGDG